MEFGRNCICEYDYRYVNLVSGKRIALVGGAPLSDLDEERIEECDLVCHTNDHWLKHGGRGELVYMEGGKLYEEKRSYGYENVLKFAQIFHGRARGKEFAAWCDEHEIPHCPYGSTQETEDAMFSPVSWWPQTLAKLYDFFPFTGVCAAYHLLLHPIQQLYVCGMTLYQQEDGTFPWRIGMHFMTPNVHFWRDLKAMQWARVNYSESMQSALDAYRDTAYGIGNIRFVDEYFNDGDCGGDDQADAKGLWCIHGGRR